MRHFVVCRNKECTRSFNVSVDFLDKVSCPYCGETTDVAELKKYLESVGLLKESERG